MLAKLVSFDFSVWFACEVKPRFMSDNPNRAHSPTHVNQTEIILISNNARNIVEIHVTEDSKLKGTQHTAKWQYRTTFFKMN